MTRVRAICDAYLTFADDRPGEHRLLFGRGPRAQRHPPRPYDGGLAAFRLLVDAIELARRDGSGGCDDPVRAAQLLWVALHGLATVPATTPGFPWRPRSELVEALVADVVGPRGPDAVDLA